MAITLRIVAFLAASLAAAQTLHLPVRSRVENHKGWAQWQPTTLQRDLPVSKTAILICDMWDNHWCTGAAQRVNELARRMNPVLEKARAAGIQVIHSPSEVMDFYKDAPQRLAILQVPKTDPPPALRLPVRPLPLAHSTAVPATYHKLYTSYT